MQGKLHDCHVVPSLTIKEDSARESASAKERFQRPPVHLKLCSFPVDRNEAEVKAVTAQPPQSTQPRFEATVSAHFLRPWTLLSRLERDYTATT